MKRTVRVLSTISLSLVLSGLAGTAAAGAQEMEHGGRRPTARSVQTNQVKTQDAALSGFAGYVRG